MILKQAKLETSCCGNTYVAFRKNISCCRRTLESNSLLKLYFLKGTFTLQYQDPIPQLRVYEIQGNISAISMGKHFTRICLHLNGLISTERKTH